MAQRLRQLMALPQARQGLLGSPALLPLNELGLGLGLTVWFAGGGMADRIGKSAAATKPGWNAGRFAPTIGVKPDSMRQP